MSEAVPRKRTGVVSSVLSVLLLLTVVSAALALIVIPKLNDARPLTVLTGSMKPTYPPGDVVIVRPVEDPRRLRVGQVITFQARSDEPSVTTHRIVGIVQAADGPAYVTRGDANGADDPKPIEPDQVRGEVWYAVPKVGYLGTWASGGTLRLVIDVGAAALVLYGGALVARGLVDRRRRGRAMT